MNSPVGLVILGAGGHGRVVLDAALSSGAASQVVFLDGNEHLWRRAVDGTEVLGGDDLLPDLPEMGITHFIVGVGNVTGGRSRKQLYERGLGAGLTPLTIAHPSICLSSRSSIGVGTYLGPGAVINTGAVIGDNVIVNSGAILEHDCRIGSHAHIASAACLGGGVEIGEGALVGSGGVIRQGLKVHEGAIVGSGAVVVADVPPEIVVAGVPARRLRKS